MSFVHILLAAFAVLGCVGARPEPKDEASTASKAFYIFGYGSLLHEGSRIRVSHVDRVPKNSVTFAGDTQDCCCLVCMSGSYLPCPNTDQYSADPAEQFVCAQMPLTRAPLLFADQLRHHSA